MAHLTHRRLAKRNRIALRVLKSHGPNGRVGGALLTHLARRHYGIERRYGESDLGLRERCNRKHPGLWIPYE
jgi:hypothetical protein